MIAGNLIPAGNAAAPVSTGVAHAGGGGWRNFGRAPICDGRAWGQLPAVEGMAGNCGFRMRLVGLVAWASSHGRVKALRSQRLGVDRRLMPDLARSCSWRAIRRGGLPPFAPAPVATTVAAASRQAGRNQAPRPCLDLRSGGSLRQPSIGSGSGRFLIRPSNGVGGAIHSGARTGSAGVGNGALRAENPRIRHGARGPFFERRGGGYVRRSPPVNSSVQMPVDKLR